MSLFITALLWAPLSFLLHNAIHEGAHALAALREGARVTRIWLLPGTKLGRFQWAFMEFEGHVSREGLIRVLVAPVVAELCWLLLTATGFALSYDEIRTICFVEMISANVDIANWLGPWWLATPKPYADAERVRFLLGKEPRTTRTWSLAYIAVLLWTLAFFMFL